MAGARRLIVLVGGIAFLAMLLPGLPAAAFVDGGFESAVLGGPDPPPMSMSFGQWTRRDDNSRLARWPEPIHSGAWSAVVDTRTSPIGSFIIQDFDSGDLSYRWTFWVLPSEGINGISLHYNWDRGVAGYIERGSGVGLWPAETTFVGWDGSASYAPVTYGVWHEFRVVADRCARTQELYIDGIFQGRVSASASLPLPTGISTMYFGDGSYSARHGLFYYDDFSVEYYDCSAPTTFYPVTVDTEPAGLLVAVDGASHAAPYTFECGANTSHTVEAASPQGGGHTRHAFDRWSNGEPRIHTITCAGPITLTARFAMEHRVTVTTSPEGLDVVVDGVPVRTPAKFWWREGSTHTLDAPGTHEVGGSPYRFDAWLDGGPPAREVTVQGPESYTVVYALVGPSVNGNLKPVVALAFSLTLFLAGLLRSRLRPLPLGDLRQRGLRTFLMLALPFIVAEAGTGVVSLLTGALAIPPLLGWGTVVDGALLVVGLVAIAVPIRARVPSSGGSPATRFE